MAGRPLQLLAALVLVAGVLGVSTALIEEVREEVLSASPPEPRFDFQPPAELADGLPIHAFTLLDPAPANLPSRSTDGHEINLTGNGTLRLSKGDRIQVAPIPLPGNATARFPSGAIADASTIACQQGCRIETDHRAFVVPPNGTLAFPDGHEVPARGELAAGQQLELPPGTLVRLDPITMQTATPMPLLAGALIEVPEDEPPPPEEGAVVQLPEGTFVRGPTDGSPTSADLSRLNQAPRIAAEDADLVEAIKPRIEITSWPDVIEKGSPFQIDGTVALPNGTPLPEHPVTLYANATKDQPGFEIQIGNVATDDAGRFQATARIPEQAPTRPYHIIGEAHARPQHDPPLATAYTDPLVPVEGDARLSIQAPAREGIHVPLPIRLELTDAFGAPMPNRTVEVTIEDAAWRARAVTDEEGHATVVAKDGLPGAGTWTIRAVFAGTEHVERADATTPIEGVRTRLVTPPTLVVPRGGEADLSGRLLREAGSVDNVTITGQVGSVRSTTTTTSSGTFSLPLSIPPEMGIGNYTLVLETTGVKATRTVIVTVTGQIQLSTDPPGALPLEGTLPLVVHASTARGDPLSGIPVEARLPDDRTRRSISDANGRALLPIPLEETPLEVTLSSEGTALLAPTSRTLTLRPSPLEVSGDLSATIGTAYNATLRLTAGAPLADEPVRLSGAGIEAQARTGPDGRAELSLAAPSTAVPGPHQARLDLPGFNLVRRVPLTVLETPRLSVDVLSSGESGDPVRLRIAAAGQQGVLEDVPLTVTAQGAFQARETGTTGSNGTAIVRLDRPGDAEGRAVITVQAERTGRTAQAVQVASTDVTPAPFPWWTLLGLVPIAGAGFAYWRHRARSQGTLDTTGGPSLRLRLRKQGDGWPPVWHPGEPATLEIELTDQEGDPLSERTLEVSGPKGKRVVETDGDGTARLRLPPHKAGTHPYTARFEGDPLHAATEATLELRVVDYREEIDDEYRRLRRQASRAGLCGSDATPRELADALGGSGQAHRLARLFERCDYSPRPVRRADYERFMRAKEACQPDGRGDR